VSPVFAHGQLRLYLLSLLDEGPRHGYEVIQDLEQRFNGLYSPSAGTVYPRLAKLEEEGLVERTDEGRKAVYRITEAGREEVRSRQSDLADLQADLDHSVRELAEQVRARVSGGASDLRRELRDAAREARAHAVPVGSTGSPWGQATGDDLGGGSPGHGGRASSGAVGELERAVAELRQEARQAWRRHGLTAEQTREVLSILTEASERIREVVRGR
jgi:DNA-binding PadR family transcriptional regulator